MFQRRPGWNKRKRSASRLDAAGLKARVLAMRARPADLRAAFADALRLAVGDADPRSDRRLAALVLAGEAIAETISRDPGRTADLPCHNHRHFAEATLAMGALCGLARQAGDISALEAVAGVVAMVGHDIDHDGAALVPGALEAHSAERSADICRAAGVAEPDAALVADVILATAPALAPENADRAAAMLPAGPFGLGGDRLRAMANEADVAVSLLPDIGLDFGEALAEEMRQAGHPAAGGVASYVGRLGFLRHYARFTPAAAALGLEREARSQIDALAAIAREAGGGTLPEDGAALLDAMPHDAARARYLAAAAIASGHRALSDIAETAPPARPGRRIQVSLTVTILTAFSVVFIAVMGSTALATYQVTMRRAIAAAEQAMSDLTSLTEARTTALIEPLYAAVAVAPALPAIAVGDNAALSASETSFRAMLGMLKQVRAVWAVGPDGAALETIDLAPLSAAARAAIAPPAQARLAVRLRSADGAALWRFLDGEGAVVGQRQAAAPADPRDNLEYRTAINTPGVATTVLHVFADIGAPGISIVRHMPDGGVFGIDVALDGLSAFLAAQRVSPRGSAMIIDDSGILVAHSDPAMAARGGEAAGWMTIASERDPLLHAIWIAFATGALSPGRDITLGAADGVAEPVWVRMTSLDDIGAPPLMVIVAAPVADFTAPVERARNRTVLLFLIAGVVGLAMIGFVAHAITKPLAALTGEADAIRRFELERPMTVSSHITEVAGLAGTMEAMKAALRTFGLYVPKDLVRQLVGGNRSARLGGERREVTVMFTDVVGFTTIADGMDAELLMRLTSEYFERMTQAAMGAAGTIDKYIGDAIMVLWNAPGRDEAHAANGCLGALRCRARSAAMAEEFARRGWPPLRTRFGLNTGWAVIGNVGSSDRMSYTAISATVNQAARLEGLNKQYGTQILVGANTRAAAGPDFVFRRVDRVLPKGQRTPADIHELLGLRRAADPQDAALVLSAADIAWAEEWDRIVEAYLDRRFAAALDLLRAAAAVRADELGAVFENRLAAFAADPPPDGWDGVMAFHEK
jgi:adenylate cyclase